MNLHVCNHYPEQDAGHFLLSLAWYLFLVISPPSKLATLLISGFELDINGIIWHVLLISFICSVLSVGFNCIVACNHSLFFALQYTRYYMAIPQLSHSFYCPYG